MTRHHRSRCRLAFLFSVGLGACAAPPPVTTIPFTLTAADNIAIRATLNGRDELVLMFHTAVNSVSLTEAAIARLDTFAVDGTATVRSWGGSTKARHSSGNSLRIGGLEWHQLELTECVESGPGTDGKFGPDLFAGRVLELDFDAGELRLHDKLPPRAASYHRLELLHAHGSFYLLGELTVGDRRYPTEFLLHTGFGGTVLLDEQFVHEHGLDAELAADGGTTLKDSYGNPVRTTAVQLPALQFGALTFRGVPAATFAGVLGGHRTSVVGARLLTRMNLIFDAERRYVYVAPNTRTAAPWPTPARR